MPGHIFSGTVGTAMLILVDRVVRRVAGAADRHRAARRGRRADGRRAERAGFGVWGIAGTICLLLGGWFLYDRAGGVSVSPVVLVGDRRCSSACSSRSCCARCSPSGACRPLRASRRSSARTGVAIGAGLNPEGIVRVSSEEWRATSADGAIDPGRRAGPGHPPRRSRAHRRPRTDRARARPSLSSAEEGRNHLMNDQSRLDRPDRGGAAGRAVPGQGDPRRARVPAARRVPARPPARTEGTGARDPDPLRRQGHHGRPARVLPGDPPPGLDHQGQRTRSPSTSSCSTR